jgi:hypothetical protein
MAADRLTSFGAAAATDGLGRTVSNAFVRPDLLRCYRCNQARAEPMGGENTAFRRLPFGRTRAEGGRRLRPNEALPARVKRGRGGGGGRGGGPFERKLSEDPGRSGANFIPNCGEFQ